MMEGKEIFESVKHEIREVEKHENWLTAGVYTMRDCFLGFCKNSFDFWVI